MPKDYESFNETVELIFKGQDVSEEELVETWSYAEAGVYEVFRLAKCLMEGYRRQLQTIRRKDVLLEAKIRQIQEKDRQLIELNKKLREVSK